MENEPITFSETARMGWNRSRRAPQQGLVSGNRRIKAGGQPALVGSRKHGYWKLVASGKSKTE